MKTKLLFFFLLTMLLQVSVDTFAMGLATRQSIKLKSKECRILIVQYLFFRLLILMVHCCRLISCCC